MSEMTPTAQSSVRQGGHSEILMVTVMITNEAGFFSEQNMVAWGLLFGKWHSVFIVIREEVVIAKSSRECLTQRRGLRNDKSESPPSPRKPWVVSRQLHGEQQPAWRRWHQGRHLGNPSSSAFHLLETSRSNESQSEHMSAKMAWSFGQDLLGHRWQRVPACSPAHLASQNGCKSKEAEKWDVQ